MPAPARATATLNVIGKDKSGVIAKICTFLYRQGGNVEEIDQHVTDGLFTMEMVISWPPRRLPEARVRQGLVRLARGLDMTILFRAHNEADRIPRLAILVTNEAHCLDHLARAVRQGKIRARIVLVASNRPTLERHVERDLHLPFLHVDDRDKSAHEATLLAEFDKHQVDYVVLARYMRILSPNVVWRYPNRIVNIHPSLLPSFPGASAYRQAHRQGVRVAGVTAHFVTMNLDEGPIIVQRSFRVAPHEGVEHLARRGRRLEGPVLAEAVQLLVQRRLDVRWGRVAVRPARTRPSPLTPTSSGRVGRRPS